ncbi:Transposon Tf2-11 polyprotein, partial [Dictyocoela muelleri]
YGPFVAENFAHEFNTNKIYIITFTDKCSRYSKVYFTTKTTSKEIQRAFKKEWLSIFNFPLKILSDNAKYYTSDDTKQFFSNLNIQQIFSSPYNPTGNSLSKRINKSISDILKIYKGWEIKIIKEVIENRLNKIINTTTKMTSEEIIKNNLTLNLYKNKNKRKFEINHVYKERDEILIRKQIFKKLYSPFEGPYKIIRISNDKQRIYYNNKKCELNYRNIKGIILYWRGEMSYNNQILFHDTSMRNHNLVSNDSLKQIMFQN